MNMRAQSSQTRAARFARHLLARGLAGWACGFAAVSQAELAAPVAGEAVQVSAGRFTATWSAVAGATGYRLDVYAYDGVPPTCVSEGFDGYPAATPAAWAVTNSGGLYDTAGNYGQAPPSVKLEADGHAITTPAYPAAVTNFSFWLKGQQASNSTLRVDASAGAGWVTLETLAVSNAAGAWGCLLEPADGYTRFRLVYDKDKGNVAVDDVSASYGDAAKAYALTNEATGNETAFAVTNLTPGVYYYVVRAADGDQVSADSNVIRVDTLAAPGPPVIAPVAPQTAHVGETLSFALTVTPTEGDPVTATNVAASAGVSGAWGLAAGVFSYAPAAGDEGQRAFAFTAADKDGTCDAVAATVTVRRARVESVRMTGLVGAHTENFDALAASGADNVWDNASEPLPAGYAYANGAEVVAYRCGTGSGTSGGIHAFGAAGSAERSLGSLASSGVTYRYGLAFSNATGGAVTNLTVSFTAEQWRAASGAVHALAFDLCVTNGVLPLAEGAWRRVEALCFASPLVTNETQAAGAVYASAALQASLALRVETNQVALLRWSDADDPGADHAFGIDDLSVTWAAEAPLAARRLLLTLE